MKKVLSVILAVIMVWGMAVPAFAAVDNLNDIPTIYIRGRGRELLDADGNTIYPFKKDVTEYVKENIKPILKSISKGLVTNNYDEYCDTMYNMLVPLYDGIRPDNNGEVTDGSTFKPDTYRERKSGYGLFNYVFHYDWRLDPCYTAEKLDEFIQYVKNLTGHEKVNIISRCYGCNVLSAYLTEYGSDDVEHIVYYASAAKGTMSCGALFAGKLDLTADTVDTFATYYLGNEEPTDELLSALVTVLNYTATLDLTADVVKKVYKAVREKLIPKLILGTVGTCPSYWAMVGDEYYEDAKAFIFDGQKEEYKGLIEKIDNYHYNVMQPLETTLKNLADDGLKVTVIVKYNCPLYPIFEGAEVQADNTVEVSNQSFGATSADFTKTLSASYIDSIKGTDVEKYLSPDEKIDASTGLFPDSTWYIRDCAHETWPNSVNKMMEVIFHSKAQMTVFDLEEYSQYQQYNNDDDETMTPITDLDEKDDNYTTNNVFKTWLKLIKAFFQTIIQKFKEAFSK